MSDNNSRAGNVRPLRPAAPAAACRLCSDSDRTPLESAPHPGPEEPTLCAPCRLHRPGRRQPGLGPADLAWRRLERDVARLNTAYERDRWIPSADELEFTAGLARMPWTEQTIRTALREAGNSVRIGRLARLLNGDAITVLRHVSADDPALHALRRLVDVLAAEAERSPWPPGAA
ncbi:hypothetical protein ACWGHM_39805 [Streptomyces sp. NPDC054904]